MITLLVLFHTIAAKIDAQLCQNKATLQPLNLLFIALKIETTFVLKKLNCSNSFNIITR